MEASLRTRTRVLVVLAAALAALLVGAGQALAAPGDPTITVPINDSEAGVTYDQTFELAFSGVTTEGTPVYIYVPEGGIGTVDGVASLDPQFDPDPADAFVPCATTPDERFVLTQAQIDQLGSELETRIVRVNEEHFGPMGGSEALVTLVYNVQDESYYDCEESTYIAGYFAPDYLTSTGMNVMVVDAFDWANRVGDQTGNDDGRSYLYEGVIAHELEHLLMEYSDATELSWVDEGLADMAIFLNDYPAGGSHLAYHQVFHRETSLTRWGGGLENYGASFTYFLYLWEQAGGNGDGTYGPDLEYDGAGGDLLIKYIFEEQADGLEGVQAAIDRWNAQTGGSLRSATELFQDWVVAVYRDDDSGGRFDFRTFDFGTEEASWGYTIDLANDVFWGGRGIYKGSMPEPRWQRGKNVPGQMALPYGASYERFTNPGPTFAIDFAGQPTVDIIPPGGTAHWWGGYENNTDNHLVAASAGPGTLSFDTWYFIEEGWDYGFVEAQVGGTWQTVPLLDESGAEVTTDENPHDNNEEGNGLTGTSGGEYFVDEPRYVTLHAELPAGTTAVRFRYSTDAAYLDTGWFVTNVQLNGAPLAVAPEDGEWQLVDGEEQDNQWVVQLIASCDLTPGVDSPGETVDNGTYVYRFAGDSIQESGFSTRCMRGRDKSSVTVAISNMPTGLLTVFDAPYTFRLSNTANSGGHETGSPSGSTASSGGAAAGQAADGKASPGNAGQGKAKGKASR